MIVSPVLGREEATTMPVTKCAALGARRLLDARRGTGDGAANSSAAADIDLSGLRRDVDVRDLGVGDERPASPGRDRFAGRARVDDRSGRRRRARLALRTGL